jgi:hypothetical protein
MSISDPANRRVGTFAEGECEPEAHPEARVGTFAEGECDPEAHPEEGHVGTFAEGECDPEVHPQEGHVGTFAEGEEQTPGDRCDQGGPVARDRPAPAPAGVTPSAR